MGPGAEQEQGDTGRNLRSVRERPKHFIGKHVDRGFDSALADSLTEELELGPGSDAAGPRLAEVN
jgi:hypothetical protein